MSIRALDKKLLRDLWRLKGQVLSIALVIASGVAMLVMALSTYEALKVTSDAYYDRYRFAQVFASVKRAPRQLEQRIKEIPGVQSVQLRVVMEAVLDVAEFPEPLMGRLVSIPEEQQPILNQLILASGRWVAPNRSDEVIINDAFAQAHGLDLGDTLRVVINGNQRPLRIVGTAMSPEFIYVLSPFALMPDKKRYGILWLGQSTLEAAFDFDGAFNSVSLSLMRGTDTQRVIDALDNLLDPYGNSGAIDRSNHLSAWFVDNELKQNQAMARLLPGIFLLVAAFLTNTVLSRLIVTERSEIGLMKAFGYSQWEVGWHYAKFVILVTLLGVVLGWGLGAFLGRISTQSYVTNLNFPLLIYRPGAFAFVAGALVSLAVALLATTRAVRQAANLAPVVAMAPPAPPLYRQGASGLQRLLKSFDAPTRIIIRQILRWPWRALITVLGFCAAIGLMVLSLYFADAIHEIARVHFDEQQRSHLALGFNEPRPRHGLQAIAALPGVLAVEPMRMVSADFVVGQRRHRGALQGMVKQGQLNRIHDQARGAIHLPEHGVVLNRLLAQKLKLRVGDKLNVKVLQGKRRQISLLVTDIYDSYIGMTAYVSLDLLNQLLGEVGQFEYAHLLIDPALEPQLLAELKQIPAVSAVSMKAIAWHNFNESLGETLWIFIGFFCGFSFALGFGVSYNAQRISLSERSRELATLRVLGFYRQDAWYILVGESLLLLMLALPLGCLAGWLLTAFFLHSGGFQTELMRLPFIIHWDIYGVALLVLLAASAFSGLAMARRIQQLDLISALKTRE